MEDILVKLYVVGDCVHSDFPLSPHDCIQMPNPCSPTHSCCKYKHMNDVNGQMHCIGPGVIVDMNGFRESLLQSGLLFAIALRSIRLI